MATAPRRRFPLPWTVVEIPAGYHVVDATGHPIGYFYGEDEETRRTAGDHHTKAEARVFAVNFARLPELLRAQALKPSGTISADGEATFPDPDNKKAAEL